jgi:molybdate transport system ATP-binding protein
LELREHYHFWMDTKKHLPGMKNSQPFITLENVTLRVGDKWLLPKTSWRINQGENWVIQGPNGAGKTTLANALMGRVAVVQGQIHRHYQQAGQADDCRPVMAMVSSEQYHHLYAREQLLNQMRDFSGKVNDYTQGADLLDLPPGRPILARGRRDDIMTMLASAPLLEKPMTALSSGEMRRLLLCRALLADPLMLILDEPFNGLDADARKVLTRLLDTLAADGTQMVLITHRLEQIPSYFSHVLCLSGGRVCRQGTRQDVFNALCRDAEQAVGAKDCPTAESSCAPGQEGSDDDSCSSDLIRMRDVSVRFGDKVVLDRLNWTVRAGEHWLVHGPNGAGKSTLLKLITGDHQQAYANEIDLFGRRKGSGETIWDIKQHIGYVSDEFQARYQKQMTGFDVICSGFFDSIGLYRWCSPDQRRIARRWIETLALNDLAGEPYNHLSFGQQRLMLIARAVVKSPRLLILDEPCNGLDNAHRQRILALVDSIGRNGPSSLIYVSHHENDIPACITHKLYLPLGSSAAQHAS